jgi:hypothetical protein
LGQQFPGSPRRASAGFFAHHAIGKFVERFGHGITAAFLWLPLVAFNLLQVGLIQFVSFADTMPELPEFPWLGHPQRLHCCH